ncbi:MAG: imidazole glycerol phosphate synthase subunit HisH [Chloroflexi bacterium]|nr:imidazole glycerol phosphate synthase subunit HisH [Chloroflexota bacterium]
MDEEATLVVVDYGAGNLRSVQRAIGAAGEQALVTSDRRDVERASALVLPGVGSANDAMKRLRALDLVEPLRAYAASGRPFLGVCVGLQLLFDWSDEGGGVDCLGIVPGTVRRFEADLAAGRKVPHMGWNSVHVTRPDPFVEGIADHSYFYFVHSYYAVPTNPADILGETQFGLPFAAMVARENVVATQFHPEKSADLGLRLYRNFAVRARGTATV